MQEGTGKYGRTEEEKEIVFPFLAIKPIEHISFYLNRVLILPGHSSMDGNIDGQARTMLPRARQTHRKKAQVRSAQTENNV